MKRHHRSLMEIERKAKELIIDSFSNMIGEQIYSDSKGYYYIDADYITHRITYAYMKYKVLGE